MAGSVAGEGWGDYVGQKARIVFGADRGHGSFGPVGEFGVPAGDKSIHHGDINGG